MRKIIMHIDLNQFFAAATRLLEPELVGKPLIIAGDHRRGIVSTASYEARKYGIRAAMSVSEAQKICPNVVILESHMELYSTFSQKFFDCDVLLAYGNLITKRKYLKLCLAEILSLLNGEQRRNVKVIKLTRSNNPVHPLYQSKTSVLKDYVYIR